MSNVGPCFVAVVYTLSWLVNSSTTAAQMHMAPFYNTCYYSMFILWCDSFYRLFPFLVIIVIFGSTAVGIGLLHNVENCSCWYECYVSAVTVSFSPSFQ